jgi:hypothetical protein
MSACAKLRKGWVLPSSLPEHGCSEPERIGRPAASCENSGEHALCCLQVEGFDRHRSPWLKKTHWPGENALAQLGIPIAIDRHTKRNILSVDMTVSLICAEKFTVVSEVYFLQRQLSGSDSYITRRLQQPFLGQATAAPLLLNGWACHRAV